MMEVFVKYDMAHEQIWTESSLSCCICSLILSFNSFGFDIFYRQTCIRLPLTVHDDI